MSYYEDAEDRHSRRSGTSKTRGIWARISSAISAKKSPAPQKRRGV